jgi:hypothetical protein
MSAKAIDGVVDATFHLDSFGTTGEYMRCLVRA